MSDHNNSLDLTPAEGPPEPNEKPLPTVPPHVRLLSRVKSWIKGLVRWWWAWEVLATTLSIAATVTLIAVLTQANGRVKTSWSLGKLTLNATVAAISTIVRAALLVAIAGPLNQGLWNRFSPSKKGVTAPARRLKDLETFSAAASDSWGSLRLLWETKGLTLAALGAMITILSLAFDAFAQQVLTEHTVIVRNETSRAGFASDALLPRAFNYTRVMIPSDNDNNPQAPIAVKGAIVSSMLNNVPLPASTCSTTNCTWPTTPTLSVCSTCNTMHLATDSQPYNVTYSAPWGDTTMGKGSNKALTFRKSSGGNENVNISVIAASPGSPLVLKGQLTIVNFHVFSVPAVEYEKLFGSYTPGSYAKTSFLDPYLAAYNCSLRFCLQSYTASTTRGKTQQQSVGTWDEVTALGAKAWKFKEVPEAMNMNIANASAYTVDVISLRALGQAFTTFMTGSVIFQGNLLQPQYSGIGRGPTPASIDSFAEVMYSASDSLESMSRLSEQIASGMSTYIRTSRPAPLDAKFAPSVSSTEIVVKVRWGWLAFPLGLLVSAQIFLVMTILQTRRRCVRPWKGHRLPLLLADTDDIVKEMAEGGLDTRNGLEDRVGRMTVRLEFDERNEIVFRRVT